MNITFLIGASNIIFYPNLVENLWHELRPVDDKRKEGRDVAQQTGQDERVSGFVVQHGLQELHALIYRQFLHSLRTKEENASHFHFCYCSLFLCTFIFLSPPHPNF